MPALLDELHDAPSTAAGAGASTRETRLSNTLQTEGYCTNSKMLNIAGEVGGIAAGGGDQGGDASPVDEGDDDETSRGNAPVRETRETACEGAA